MDDSGPRSLFVVVLYSTVPPHFSILQLERQEEFTDADRLAEHVVCFNEAKELPWTKWSVSPPISSNGDLYLFPDWYSPKPLQGFNFNFSTGSFRNIRLPESMTPDGVTESLVNHQGKTYRIQRSYSRSVSDYCAAESDFDCYVPETNSWTALKPVPYLPYDTRVTATAVWRDTILFIVDPQIWAYDVKGDEWYDVDVEHVRCCSIVGEGVVLDNTIYALSDVDFGLILALSFKTEGRGGGGLVIKCSLSSVISVPNLEEKFPREYWNKPIPLRYEGPRDRTTHLVHLGKRNFCIVQSCDPLFPNDHKPIHVTYMSLQGKTKMNVTAERMFKARYESPSEVVLCFSLSKCKTAALEEGKPFVKELDPYTAEGHYSICVRDYPLNVTVSQLVKVLNKFGKIKRDGIQVMRSKKGMALAYVEYESLVSMQRAIRAKTVTLGGCPAEISTLRH